jgi:hypothetical protein
VTDVPEEHDPSDKLAAMALALETRTFYTGLFYKDQRATFGERVEGMRPAVDEDRLERLLERFKR